MTQSKTDVILSFIPWNSPELWEEVNQAMAYLVRRRRRELTDALHLAGEILCETTSIFPKMDELCSITCPLCPEPCCLVAKLWFDFKDLIFLHLTNQPIPRAQPLHHYEDVCRYLNYNGCTLSRSVRPWICTFYICPTQTAYFRKHQRSGLKQFNERLEQIKNNRIKMENNFLQAITTP